MSLNVAESRLDVYLPGNTSRVQGDADASITGGDFEFLSVDPRLQDLIDTGEIHVRNRNGQYTDAIRSGCRVEVYTQIGTESSLSHLWTGMVRAVQYNELGATDASIKMDVEDWVFSLMSMREVVAAFEGRTLAGSSDSVLNTILQRKTPEIDRSQIDAFDVREEAIYNGKSLLDVARQIGERVDAVMWSDKKRLVFTPLGDITSDFTLEPYDRGIASNTVNDDALVNRLRVHGATDSKLENFQESFDSFTTVTDTNRLQVQVATRKSAVSQVEIYTDPLAGSNDDLIVRVHPDDPEGSGPVAVDDPESDYARRRLSHEFLAADGWTTFLIPDHRMNDPDPWIIVESDGQDGQDVGVNATGDVMYRQYFPFPTDMIIQDASSASRYRRREAAHLKTELTDRQALADYARAKLNRLGKPDRELKFPADSERTHNLTPGTVLDVPSDPKLALRGGGRYIVYALDHTYDGSRLHTNVVLQDTETV